MSSYVRFSETNNLSNTILLPIWNLGVSQGSDIVQMKTSISQGGGFYPQCRSNAEIATTKWKVSGIIEGITDDERQEFIEFYKALGNNPIQTQAQNQQGFIYNNLKSTFIEEPSFDETEPGLWNLKFSIRGIN